MDSIASATYFCALYTGNNTVTLGPYAWRCRFLFNSFIKEPLLRITLLNSNAYSAAVSITIRRCSILELRYAKSSQLAKYFSNNFLWEYKKPVFRQKL